jgi:hypothetical protein
MTGYGFLASLVPLIVLFALVLAVLWFLLPFAVFGIKKRMDRIESRLDTTNALLQLLLDEAKRPRS